MTGILWLARQVIPRVLFHGIRPIGAMLPPSALQTIAGPVVAAVTFVELAYAGPTFAEFDRLPASFRASRNRWAWRLALWRQRTRLNQAKLASFWPDLLATPRWRRLCRLDGSQTSLGIIGAGTRPVILVTLHLGPFAMLCFWFRSRRMPIASLTAEGEPWRPWYRQRLLLLSDRATGLDGVPRLFLTSQLRKVADFLRANRLLLVLASGGSGQHIEVSDGDVSLPLSPGVLRLAARVDAVVIPCVIHAGPRGTMTITLGDPVPPADVIDRQRHRAVCEQFFRFWLVALRLSPGQADPWLLQRLRPRVEPDDGLARPGASTPGSRQSRP